MTKSYAEMARELQQKLTVDWEDTTPFQLILSALEQIAHERDEEIAVLRLALKKAVNALDNENLCLFCFKDSSGSQKAHSELCSIKDFKIILST